MNTRKMPDKHELVLTRLVLDVLKPHKPGMVEFAQALTGLRGVTKVEVSIIEVDADTETVKLTVEGNNINFEQIANTVKQLGAAVHSVDQVTYSHPTKQQT
ncbi:conserved hypothetical protein [Candidatus Caldarchaeum subterraneum]|uniref:DUF211 domain-containing protein n=3 Tax=Thermoproteati TaxID=1783275 RepID=E6NAL6_CALS0|nr:conserved hypothetical protein [Candidatus Caldarchaeum subterraneum]BAJ50441.1 conserved hypothetical protein [Candidatus Caldarchaeum subterraneum]